jgi:hypothetical protein
MSAPRQFSVIQLYEDHREKLKLSWVVAVGVDRQIELREQSNYGADVVGHLNLIHPERLQVIGRAEHAWAQRVTVDRLRQQVRELMAREATGADHRRRSGHPAGDSRRLRVHANAAVCQSEALFGGDRLVAHLSFAPSGRFDVGAWRADGCVWNGCSDYRRFRCWQERTGPGADFARSWSGRRRCRRAGMHRTDNDRRTLSEYVA